MKPSELLAEPSAWTQHTSARNKDGDSVFSFANDAACWCVYGAFVVCYKHISHSDAAAKCRKAYQKASQLGLVSSTWGSFIDWQDAPERTHAEVIAALKAVGE